MEEREKIAWAAVAIAVIAAVFFGALWMQGPAVRTVEKPVEKIVEKRVEVPVQVQGPEIERVVYRESEAKEPSFKDAFTALMKHAEITDALKGAGAVRIHVSAQDEKKKLDLDALQTKAELRLRSLSIPVSKSGVKEKHCVVAVRFLCLWSQDNTFCSYHAEVSASVPCLSMDLVAEKVNLQTDAIVWHRGYIAHCGSLKFEDAVGKLAETLVDEFANDYLAANPKK